MHDLLTGAHYSWQGAYNYVELNPQALPAHILRIERDATGRRSSRASGKE
jgi:starch synthase (maltosyl-transferring)